MSKEMRVQIDKIKNFGEFLNEDIKPDMMGHINFRNIDYKKVNKIYDVISDVDYNHDFNIIKNSNILLSTISLKQEEILYNSNQKYKELYDKDEDGIISNVERDEMEFIYKKEAKKEESKMIIYYYEKYKNENTNMNYVNWVESMLNV